MNNNKKTTDKFPRTMVLPDGTVFKAYGVTTINNSFRLATTHKPAMPVDWAFWPASRRVTRDEAIALSLGLDPHSLYSNIDGRINPEFCPDNATAILFLKRLNLLTACNSRTNIPLSEIAAWAVSISLSPIPPELEAIARHGESVSAPALQNNAPVNPAKVGDGETVSEDDKPNQEADEPPMRVGSNLAKAYKPWIVWQAEKLKQKDDIFATLARRIVDLANERKYRNQGGNEFTLGTVTRALSETKMTGGRSKNGRKSSKNNSARQFNPTPNHSAKSTKARKPL